MVEDQNVGVVKSELVLVNVCVVAGDVVVTALAFVSVTNLVDTLISQNNFRVNISISISDLVLIM